MKAVLRRWKVRVGPVSPRQYELALGLSVPLLLMVIAIAGEAVLRFDQIRRFGTAETTEVTVRGNAIWERKDARRRPRPGAKLGQIRFSRDGFRGEPLNSPKQAGTIRIGFFGSSTTIDLYVSDDSATWPAVAVGELRKTFPSCHFEFFNAGVPGYTVRATMERATQDAKPYQPDLAIFLLNDVSSRSKAQLRARGVNMRAYQPSVFGRTSTLWSKIEKNYAAKHLLRMASRKDTAQRLDLNLLASTIKVDAAELVDRTLAVGALPVLVENAPKVRREQSRAIQIDNAISRVLYMPGVYIGDLTESTYIYNDQLRIVAHQRNIPFVPTLTEMPDDATLYADSSHTTKAGSRIFGEIVGKELARNTKLIELLNERGHVCATPPPLR